MASSLVAGAGHGDRAANAVALALLVGELVSGAANQGMALLLAAGQVWFTNIIIFVLAFWELDRGGPVRRTEGREHAYPRLIFVFLRTRITTPSAKWRPSRR